MIYLRIDQVMLGNMVGSEELGNYSVAVRISEAWYFIPDGHLFFGFSGNR